MNAANAANEAKAAEIIDEVMETHEIPLGCDGPEWDDVRANIAALDGRADRGDEWTAEDDRVQWVAVDQMFPLVMDALEACA